MTRDWWNNPAPGDYAKAEAFIDGPANKHHRPPRIADWFEGMVLWNFSTQLFDRVKIKDSGRYRVMSYPIDVAEDEETAWASTHG